MGLLDTVKAKLRQAKDATAHPAAALASPLSDLVVVTEPARGAVWRVGSRVPVSWVLKGVVGQPLDVTLVRLQGTRTEDVAVLATDIDLKQLQVVVTVPDVAPGGDYAVYLSSGDPMDVYSPSLTIAPAEAEEEAEA